MKLRFICMALALVLAAGVFAACSKDTPVIDNSTSGSASAAPSGSDLSSTDKPSYNLPTGSDSSASTTTAGSSVPGTTSAPGASVPASSGAAAGVTAAGTTRANTTAAAVSTGAHKLGAYTASSSVTLRVKPDASSTALNSVTSGASVKVLAVQGDWGYVMLNESTWGWANMSNLTAAGAADAASSTGKTGKYSVNTESSLLTLRMAPDKRGLGITGLSKGTVVDVLAVQGTWGYVTISDTCGGWLSLEYLKAA